jgi:hypothetical protein
MLKHQVLKALTTLLTIGKNSLSSELLYYIFYDIIGLLEFVISLTEKGNNFFMASGLLMAPKLFFKRLLTLIAFFLWIPVMMFLWHLSSKSVTCIG